MNSYPSLKDRLVVVTGGSRGLGRSMALSLLRAGARVAIVSRQRSGPLEETCLQASSISSSRWMSVLGDLQQPTECARVTDEIVSRLGAIEVLVNNAAIPMDGPGLPFWRLESEYWMRMSRVNCDSVFLMSKCIVPSMIERGVGKVVNISTGYATMVRDTFSPYGPTKAFVEACTRIWANELKGTGVTMNALLPGGAVDTAADVTGSPRSDPTFLPSSIMDEPMLWLASDESNEHNGERFVANRWRMELDLAARIAAARESGVAIPSIM
jgi:NAD(P)-dependent dehydrogenase (short-subunit alcohol dehydrogenase family)